MPWPAALVAHVERLFYCAGLLAGAKCCECGTTRARAFEGTGAACLSAAPMPEKDSDPAGST